jgi:AcrR family transcriptional regulator
MYIGNNKKASKNRKEKVFEAALQCFNKRGYYKTSLDEIASKGKISKGGIYYHFRSKEQLFRELFSFRVSKYFEQLDVYMQEGNDPAERIRILAKKSGQILSENDDFFKFCLEFLSMGVREPGIRREMTHFYKDTLKTFAQLIDEGKSTGIFRDLDSEKVARVLYLLFMGVFFTYFSTDIDFDLIDQETFNINTLLKGIQFRKRR